MCYGSPAKSLEIARSRLTPEQWARFEREFEVFCVVQGLTGACEGETRTLEERIETQAKAMAFTWAKWAFFQGRGYSDRSADQRVADAKYTRLAIAMMDDEQREQSLERFGEFEDRWIAARVAQSYGKEKT